MSITHLQPEARQLTSTVARRVRGLLAELGMAQQDLAPIIGVSGSAVSKRLRGAMPFALDELPVMAGALGTSMEYLLGLTDDRSPRQATEASEVVHPLGLEPRTR